MLMLLYEFTIPPMPYSGKLQLILVCILALSEIVTFTFWIRKYKNTARQKLLLALLVLLAAITYFVGEAFYEHYYQDFLKTQFGEGVAANIHLVFLFRLKEFFTITSLLGLLLATLTQVIHLVWTPPKA